MIVIASNRLIRFQWKFANILLGAKIIIKFVNTQTDLNRLKVTTILNI